MTFEGFLDQLNKGGFQFLGMVLIAAILYGVAWGIRWFVQHGWPALLATITKASSDYKESVQLALTQTSTVIEKQAAMQDKLMDSHGAIMGKMDIMLTKMDGIADKVGGSNERT